MHSALKRRCSLAFCAARTFP